MGADAPERGVELAAVRRPGRGGVLRNGNGRAGAVEALEELGFLIRHPVALRVARRKVQAGAHDHTEFVVGPFGDGLEEDLVGAAAGPGHAVQELARRGG